MNILYVEDHPAVAEIACRLLVEHHGHVVTHAANGQDAVRLAGEIVPDLALIDLNLPDMNGYEVAQAFRANPRLARTVLVALTGFGNIVDAERASGSGFDAHFRKPMDFELLDQLYRDKRG